MPPTVGVAGVGGKAFGVGGGGGGGGGGSDASLLAVATRGADESDEESEEEVLASGFVAWPASSLPLTQPSAGASAPADAAPPAAGPIDGGGSVVPTGASLPTDAPQLAPLGAATASHAGEATTAGASPAPASPTPAAAGAAALYAALGRLPSRSTASPNTNGGALPPAARASPPAMSDEERVGLRADGDGLFTGRSSSEESDALVEGARGRFPARMSPKRPRADGERMAVPDNGGAADLAAALRAAGTPPAAVGAASTTPLTGVDAASTTPLTGVDAAAMAPLTGVDAAPSSGQVVDPSPAHQVLRLRLAPPTGGVNLTTGAADGRSVERSLSNNSTPVSDSHLGAEAKGNGTADDGVPAHTPTATSLPPAPSLPPTDVRGPAMHVDSVAAAGAPVVATPVVQKRSSARLQQASPAKPPATASQTAAPVASTRGKAPAQTPAPVPQLIPPQVMPAVHHGGLTAVQLHRAAMPLRLVYNNEAYDEDMEFALSNPPFVPEYGSFFDSAGRINYPSVLKPGEKLSAHNKRDMLQRFRRPARAVPGSIPPLLTPASYASFGLNTAMPPVAAAAAVPAPAARAVAPAPAHSLAPAPGLVPKVAPVRLVAAPSAPLLHRTPTPPISLAAPALGLTQAVPASLAAVATPVVTMSLGAGAAAAAVHPSAVAVSLPLPPPPRTREEEMLRMHVQRATHGLTSAQVGLRLLLTRREMLIRQRIQERQAQLRTLPVELPNDVRRLAVIEAKQFKLLHLQQAVRARVLAERKRLLLASAAASPPLASDALATSVAGVASASVAGIVTAVCDRYQRPTPASSFGHRFGVGSVGLATVGFWGNTSRLQKIYLANQAERHRKQRQGFHERLSAHALAFRDGHSRLAADKRKLLTSVDRYFRDRAKEEERRKRREMVERMNALKNNDEEAYLKLLSKTKNERLLQVLRQTDRYLAQIGAQVEKQKEAGGAALTPATAAAQMRRRQRELQEEDDGADVEEADVAGDYDSLAAMSRRRQAYYTLSHSIQEKVHQPDSLVGGTLKPYQVEGLSWLVSLFNNNLNGILADEMGLGKTIQTIALLAYLVHVKQQKGPFLVIVPLSTMSNWVRELNAWAPSLVKVVYRGDPNTRRHLQATAMRPGTFQVLLTTYEFVVKDQSVLSRTSWLYIIMDEGHRMKNAHCKLAMTLGVRYRSRSRLLLTGTPLQNNLTELWALLNFLLPTIFSSSDSFESWFSAPFQARAMGDAGDLNSEETLLVINRLHQVLRPFLLRRLKTDVEKQLPDKVESIIRCDMSAWQRVLYRQVSAKIGIAAGGGANVRSFNNMLMQLKKICNHPYLFCDDDTIDGLPDDWLIRASGKFAFLANVLPKLLATGHRVLLFSQMTRALDYLEDLLDYIRVRFLRLDGTTKAEDRQEKLEQFNEKDSPYGCFLLSTRAGGLGLNLQTADTVIIFDSDWNPQVRLLFSFWMHLAARPLHATLLLVSARSFFLR